MECTCHQYYLGEAYAILMGENNILPLNSEFIILVVTQRKREAEKHVKERRDSPKIRTKKRKGGGSQLKWTLIGLLSQSHRYRSLFL